MYDSCVVRVRKRNDSCDGHCGKEVQRGNQGSEGSPETSFLVNSSCGPKLLPTQTYTPRKSCHGSSYRPSMLAQEHCRGIPDQASTKRKTTYPIHRSRTRLRTVVHPSVCKQLAFHISARTLRYVCDESSPVPLTCHTLFPLSGSEAI